MGRGKKGGGAAPIGAKKKNRYNRHLQWLQSAHDDLLLVKILSMSMIPVPSFFAQIMVIVNLK